MRALAALALVAAAGSSARAEPACDRRFRGYVNGGVDLGSSFGTATSWTGPDPACYDTSLPTVGARLALGFRPFACMQVVAAGHAYYRDEATTPTGDVMTTHAEMATAHLGFRLGGRGLEIGASFGAGLGRTTTTLRGSKLEGRAPVIDGHIEIVFGTGAVAGMVYLDISQWFVDDQYGDFYVPRVGGYALGAGVHRRF